MADTESNRNIQRKNAVPPSRTTTKLRSSGKCKKDASVQKTAATSSKIELPTTSGNPLNKRTTADSKSTTKKKNKKRGSYLAKPDVVHTYLTHYEIIQYLTYVKSRYSDLVTLHVLGYSYENRAIIGIEINSHNKGEPARKLVEQPQTFRGLSSAIKVTKLAECPSGRNMIFIEGGTHAREWLSISVALYCIYQLTENSLLNRELLENLSFFIVPLVNPDGYEYCRKTNRRWRKNRRPHTFDNYIGTDCNRNFDFHWKICDGLTKSNTYQGEMPFSEPETRAIADMLHALQPQLLLFLSLHSYGQSIMYPWGYTKAEAENTEMLCELAMVACKSIKSYNGRNYRIGSIAQISGRNIAGSVVDYAYGVVKVPLAFVLELPSKEYGFQPPLRLIPSLGQESWLGIREMCKHAFTLKDNFEANVKAKA